MKPMRTEQVETHLELLTPGDEYRWNIKKCQWCHGELTKENRNELISRRDKNKKLAVSVGMICDRCYSYLISGPEIDFIGHAIYARYVHEHIHDYDNRMVPPYDPKKSLAELKRSY